MIGSFGVIDEELGDGAESFTHQERFGGRRGDLRLRNLRWQTGRDLLLLCNNSTGSDPAGLPPRPRRGQEQLWIPVGSEDTRVLGPIYSVGTQTAGHLIRVVAERDIRFLPELEVVVGAQRARVLGAIDGLDPSRRRQLEKAVRTRDEAGLGAVNLFGKPQRSAAGSPLAALPPAAKTILTTIERDLLGASHVLSFRKRGAGSLVELLEGRGLIRILSSGQILTESRYKELREALDSGFAADPKSVSKLWGTSVGMASALLESFALDGMLDSASSGRYKGNRDDPA